jgi:hypothetical protein
MQWGWFGRISHCVWCRRMGGCRVWLWKLQLETKLSNYAVELLYQFLKESPTLAYTWRKIKLCNWLLLSAPHWKKVSVVCHSYGSFEGYLTILPCTKARHPQISPFSLPLLDSRHLYQERRWIQIVYRGYDGRVKYTRGIHDQKALRSKAEHT